MDDLLNDSSSDSPKVETDGFYENTFLLNRLNAIPVDPKEIYFIKTRSLPIAVENEYLQRLLDWERAPMKYVFEWLETRPRTIDAKTASDEEVAEAVKTLTLALRAVNHVVLYTEHLSDRRLYQLLVHEVLNCDLKYLPNPDSPHYWNFCPCTEESDYACDEDEESDSIEDDASCNCVRERVWLTYYATESQRKRWARRYGRELPPKAEPPYPRPYIRELVDFH